MISKINDIVYILLFYNSYTEYKKMKAKLPYTKGKLVLEKEMIGNDFWLF